LQLPILVRVYRSVSIFLLSLSPPSETVAPPPLIYHPIRSISDRFLSAITGKVAIRLRKCSGFLLQFSFFVAGDADSDQSPALSTLGPRTRRQEPLRTDPQSIGSVPA
uniref:Secreted protein n=1 Tax=Heligmosomoides polygyrus TaxID=6339 RepID=A0A183GLN4_HELPZ